MPILKKILRSLVVFLGLVVVGLLIWRKTHRSTLLVDYGSVSDFSLTDQSGETVTLSSLKGNPWVANFIFTRCQGPCPLIAYKTSELLKEFSNSPRVKFIFFSVDPVHDTPPVLAKYGESYKADPARWHLLTGDKKVIYSLIRDGFRLAIEDVPKNPGSIDDFIHSTFFVLVDKNARILGYYNSTDNDAVERLRADIKKWM